MQLRKQANALQRPTNMLLRPVRGGNDVREDCQTAPAPFTTESSSHFDAVPDYDWARVRGRVTELIEMNSTGE